MDKLTVAQLMNIVRRAQTVIETTEGADEHAELVNELKALGNLCEEAIDGSHMGTAADEVILAVV